MKIFATIMLLTATMSLQTMQQKTAKKMVATALYKNNALLRQQHRSLSTDCLIPLIPVISALSSSFLMTFCTGPFKKNKTDKKI